MVELRPVSGPSVISSPAIVTDAIKEERPLLSDPSNVIEPANSLHNSLTIAKHKAELAKVRHQIIEQLSVKAQKSSSPEKIILPNGLTIIADKIPDTEFCHVIVAVKAGAVHEKKTTRGIAHFIEHNVFKGTTSEGRETEKAINIELEGLGTAEKSNASTDSETTMYYSEVLGGFAPYVLDVLLDILCNPRFNEGDIEKEKGVVKEEIKMYRDDPRDFLRDHLHYNVWKHPLGKPVLGTRKSVSSLNRAEMLEFVNSNYTPDNMIVSVAGNFDFDKIVEVANTHTAHITKRKKEREIPELKYKPGTSIFKRRDIEQTHLIFATEGVNFTSDDWHTLEVLEKSLTLLSSSRLWSGIRGNEGLAYTVTSERTEYSKGGTFSIYTAIPGEKLDFVLTLILTQLKDIKDNGLKEEELEIAKINLITEYVRDNESLEERAQRNITDEVYFGKSSTLKDDIDKIQQVTNEKIINLINKMFRPELISLFIMGPEVDDDKEQQDAENIGRLPTRQKLQAIIDKFAKDWDKPKTAEITEPPSPQPPTTLAEPKAA